MKGRSVVYRKKYSVTLRVVRLTCTYQQDETFFLIFELPTQSLCFCFFFIEIIITLATSANYFEWQAHLWLCNKWWSFRKGPGRRGHIVADTNVSPFARERNICCRDKFCVRDTKNVSDLFQKHFVPATNVSQFAQPKKHHEQQYVRNSVSSFARAFIVTYITKLVFIVNTILFVIFFVLISSLTTYNCNKLLPIQYLQLTYLQDVNYNKLRTVEYNNYCTHVILRVNWLLYITYKKLLTEKNSFNWTNH